MRFSPEPPIGGLVDGGVSDPTRGVTAWASILPGPLKVGYEARPTGYALRRHLNDHGGSCVVGAPSKQRSARRPRSGAECLR